MAHSGLDIGYMKGYQRTVNDQYGRPMFESAVQIGLDNVQRGYDVMGQLLGDKGENLMYVERKSNAQLSLTGKGAEFLNPNMPPSNQPLQIVIRHQTNEGLHKAETFLQDLVGSVRDDYEDFLKRQGNQGAGFGGNSYNSGGYGNNGYGNASGFSGGSHFCDICNQSFQSDRDYRDHCQSVMHTQKQMQMSGKSGNFGGARNDNYQGGNRGGSGGYNRGKGNVSQGEKKKIERGQRMFVEMLRNQTSDRYLQVLYEQVEAKAQHQDNMSSDQYNRQLPPHRINFCRLCMEDVYDMAKHIWSENHRMKYLNMQLHMGFKKFAAVYGDVTLPDLDTYGGKRLGFTGLDNTYGEAVPQGQCDVDAYKEMIVLAGQSCNYYCELCSEDTRNVKPWIQHCGSYKHARMAVDKVRQVGDRYKQTFGSVPAPLDKFVIEAASQNYGMRLNEIKNYSEPQQGGWSGNRGDYQHQQQGSWAEQMEQERRREQERMEQERREKERREQERRDQERREMERREMERREMELRREQERLQQERLQQERMQQERMQQERMQQEQMQRQQQQMMMQNQQQQFNDGFGKYNRGRQDNFNRGGGGQVKPLLSDRDVSASRRDRRDNDRGRDNRRDDSRGGRDRRDSGRSRSPLRDNRRDAKPAAKEADKPLPKDCVHKECTFELPFPQWDKHPKCPKHRSCNRSAPCSMCNDFDVQKWKRIKDWLKKHDLHERAFTVTATPEEKRLRKTGMCLTCKKPQPFPKWDKHPDCPKHRACSRTKPCHICKEFEEPEAKWAKLKEWLKEKGFEDKGEKMAATEEEMVKIKEKEAEQKKNEPKESKDKAKDDKKPEKKTPPTRKERLAEQRKREEEREAKLANEILCSNCKIQLPNLGWDFHMQCPGHRVCTLTRTCYNCEDWDSDSWNTTIEWLDENNFKERAEQVRNSVKEKKEKETAAKAKEAERRAAAEAKKAELAKKRAEEAEKRKKAEEERQKELEKKRAERQKMLDEKRAEYKRKRAEKMKKTITMGCPETEFFDLYDGTLSKMDGVLNLKLDEIEKERIASQKAAKEARAARIAKINAEREARWKERQEAKKNKKDAAAKKDDSKKDESKDDKDKKEVKEEKKEKDEKEVKDDDVKEEEKEEEEKGDENGDEDAEEEAGEDGDGLKEAEESMDMTEDVDPEAVKAEDDDEEKALHPDDLDKYRQLPLEKKLLENSHNVTHDIKFNEDGFQSFSVQTKDKEKSIYIRATNQIPKSLFRMGPRSKFSGLLMGQERKTKAGLLTMLNTQKVLTNYVDKFIEKEDFSKEEVEKANLPMVFGMMSSSIANTYGMASYLAKSTNFIRRTLLIDAITDSEKKVAAREKLLKAPHTGPFIFGGALIKNKEFRGRPVYNRRGRGRGGFRGQGQRSGPGPRGGPGSSPRSGPGPRPGNSPRSGNRSGDFQDSRKRSRPYDNSQQRRPYKRPRY